jgi:lactate dehydrogenase-like 2-hydroxyacid dehydrogenase
MVAEFLSFGALYHNKLYEKSMEISNPHVGYIKEVANGEKVGSIHQRKIKEYDMNQKLAIVAYGKLGQTCAQFAKRGLGMRVVGVNMDKSNEPITNRHREMCDQIIT